MSLRNPTMPINIAFGRTFIVFTCAVILAHWSTAASSEVIEIFPGDSFEAAAEILKPGDTLIIHEGIYVDDGRISIDVKGTASSPVIIKAAANERRPLITRSADASTQNTINIEGAEHLTIRGLEISGNGGDGINMSGQPSYITLEDLVIHDIAVGINFRSDMHHIAVRRNHIYATNDTGEGMYVGCNNATCAVSHALIENNWIHDTRAASQGDGIEIKRGSHSNVIRDNVIHDTNWPCILLYGTEGKPRNVVERNVMWGCGEAGIQVAADAIVRNNIVLDSPDDGLLSHAHQGVTPENLEIVHNTLITDGNCMRISDWNGRKGIVLANNAFYCSIGFFSLGGLDGVTLSGNVFEQSPFRVPAGGYIVGHSKQEDFVDAGKRDVYPSDHSALLGAGDSRHSVSDDFNSSLRNDRVDAGAYTWIKFGNPGWKIAPGFKPPAVPGPALP